MLESLFSTKLALEECTLRYQTLAFAYRHALYWYGSLIERKECYGRVLQIQESE